MKGERKQMEVKERMAFYYFLLGCVQLLRS